MDGRTDKCRKHLPKNSRSLSVRSLVSNKNTSLTHTAFLFATFKVMLFTKETYIQTALADFNCIPYCPLTLRYCFLPRNKGLKPHNNQDETATLKVQSAYCPACKPKGMERPDEQWKEGCFDWVKHRIWLHRSDFPSWASSVMFPTVEIIFQDLRLPVPELHGER